MKGPGSTLSATCQKNKAKQIVGKVSLIQSVDSQELMALIDRLALERGIVQDILLEVNVAGEAAKSGFRPEDVAAAIDAAANIRGFSSGVSWLCPRFAATAKKISHIFFL